MKSENIQSTLEEADLSDIIGYAEYLGKQKMRLFNSPNSETIYIIKKERIDMEFALLWIVLMYRKR